MTAQPPPPVILGLVGGIASGKSFWAARLAEAGAAVISADAIVDELYRTPEVLATLQSWWGPRVVAADGRLDRRAVARIIFSDPAERRRLEAWIHPLVAQARDRRMRELAQSQPPPRLVVWDIPLLLEANMHRDCSAIAYVDTPDAVRHARAQARGWSPDELARRESAQLPLAAKRAAAQHILPGTCTEPQARQLAHQLLHQLLTHP